MAAPVILIILLLCFLAFFLWDRKRLNNGAGRPLSRERMNRGFTPSAALGWPISFVLGLVSVALAFAEWHSPSLRPYSGRWAWFNEAVYQAFGPNGLAGAYLAAGLVAVGYGLVHWQQTRLTASSRTH